jgi:hypothetical protein
LHTRILKQAAYKGDRARFAQILKRLGTGVPEPQLHLLHSLAYRDLLGFKKFISLSTGVTSHSPVTSGSVRRLSQHIFNFLDDLALAQYDFTPAQLKNLTLFYSEILKTLKQGLENPLADSEHLQQLIYAFSQTKQDQWIAGNATIRRGIVKIGKVSLNENTSLVCPFKLSAPRSLPLREHFFMPVGYRDQYWVLQ